MDATTVWSLGSIVVSSKCSKAECLHPTSESLACLGLMRRRVTQVPGANFNAAQLAVIGADGQLPKLDLAFLLRFYAEFHVGISAVLQVLPTPSSPWCLCCNWAAYPVA